MNELTTPTKTSSSFQIFWSSKHGRCFEKLAKRDRRGAGGLTRHDRRALETWPEPRVFRKWKNLAIVVFSVKSTERLVLRDKVEVTFDIRVARNVGSFGMGL